jgi:hypothetical protein
MQNINPMELSTPSKLSGSSAGKEFPPVMEPHGSLCV